MVSVIVALFSLLPIFLGTAVAMGLSTVIVTVIVAMAIGSSIPSWMKFPPLSLIGFGNPERVVFAIGSTASAVVVFVGLLLYHMLVRVLIVRDDRASRLAGHANVFAFAAATVSCVAAAIQGNVSLQPDIMHALLGHEAFTPETFVHQAAASVAWIAMTVHAATNLLVSVRCRQLTAIRRSYWFRAKAALLAVSLISMFASVLVEPSFPADPDTVMAYFVFSGACQWVSVVSALLIFLCYAADARDILELIGVRVFLVASSRARRAGAVPVPDEAATSSSR